ncbi:MAG: nitroreductase family protein [Candidatus Micrarchaeota archaeon]|nr:nitroreductase family protein [Candidatus Micrarchaeota archaeon]
MEYFDLIKTRRSRRAFKPKPLTEQQINSIVEAANLAPSAGNLQSFSFYLVKEKKAKEKLAEAAFGQGFISEAPAVFVFFAKAPVSSKKYGERGKLYATIDAAVSAAYAQLAVETLGLGTVWVGAFNEEKVKALLNEDGLPICLLPVGYPNDNPEKHPRQNRLKKVV